MGNTQKIQEQTISHPKLGQVIPQQRYGKQYIVYSRVVPPTASLESWEQQYHKLSDARKDCLFLPQTYSVRSNQKAGLCCGSNQIVDLTYQNYMYVLDEEIQNRRQQQKPYTEPDLWFMLYHMLGAAYQMQIRDIRIGDIRPKNILLNQNGTIKIITRMSWPGQESGFQKVFNGNGQKCYLAPQQLRVLEDIRESVDLKSNKTEAFSIGLTALQLATLQSSQTLYDYKNKVFNTKLLQSRLQRCSQRYSPFFTQVIKTLTDLNPKDRASSGECWATLSPYGQSIDNVLPFKANRQKSQQALDQYIKRIKSGRY